MKWYSTGSVCESVCLVDVDVVIGAYVPGGGCASVVAPRVCVYITSGGCAGCCSTREVYWRCVHKLACVVSVVSWVARLTPFPT